MRTVWTMGFVAAAALSFCFPDFIVFRFTQATIWAIALLGLVLLCGVSGQFSFAQAALFGVGGYSAAIIGAHPPFSVYWGLPAALLMGYAAGWGLGRIAGGHSLWTQALVTYAATPISGTVTAALRRQRLYVLQALILGGPDGQVM